jgi:chitodextrinase
MGQYFRGASPVRVSRSIPSLADDTGAVFALAAKRTALAAASMTALVALSILVPTGGASSDRRDKQAPTTPLNLRVVAATPSLVSIAWDPSVDDAGVAGYYVFGDKGKAIVDTPMYIVRDLKCGESTVVNVIAFDEAQNRSERAMLTVSTAACADTQPPTPPSGFTQLSTTRDAVVLGWNPSSDDTRVVEYGVYRDLQRVATAAEPNVALAGLACGSTYAYAVDAADASGNRSPRSNVYVRTTSCATPPAADTTPPSTPTGLAASGVTQTGLALSWNASSDNVGVVGYDVYRNGAKVASPTSTNLNQSSLACGSSYSFAVAARDAAGNTSSQAQLSVSTSACSQPPPPVTDTTPPSTPTGLAASGVTQTGLALSWNASSDNVGVVGYDVYRNGAKVASPTSTNLNQSSLACGSSYSFAVAARDAAGNTSSQAQLSVSTSACSPPADTTSPSTPSGLGVSGATSTSVSLRWTASTDNVGVAGYRVYVNSAYSTTTAQLAATVSGLACGSAYVFQVDAFDLEGNGSARASVTASTAACADTQAPSAPLNVAATSRTATSIALAWSASTDNVGVTGYGLFRAGSQVATTSLTNAIFSGLACNTNYTLAVDASDAAGNRSAKTTVMVATTACPDTTPPSTPSGLAASNITQSGLTLTWNASSDNVGVTGYDVYRNGTKMTTASSTSSSQTGLACGTSYTLGVVARDAAGNSSSQASLQATTSSCAAPAPSNRYTNIDFTGSRYDGQGVRSIFEAVGSDSRLSDWGGTDASLYDQWGMSTDTNQRVHLAQVGGRLASWQELRTTDSYWQAATPNLAKASVNMDQAATWGPGGFAWGIERWFAFDIYFPLNVNGVSFEFSNSWHTLGDIHSTVGNADNMTRVYPNGNSNPKYLTSSITKDWATVPYHNTNLIQLTDASGNRISSAFNAWHEVVIGVKTACDGSVGNSSGWVEVWVDGAQKLARTAMPQYECSEGGPYFQLQNYTTYPTSFVSGATRSAIVYGGYRAGMTRADVQTR